MRRAIVLAAAVAALAMPYVVQTLRDPGAGQRAAAVADRAAQLRQGAYLARAGNCMGCHTVRGDTPYAGGRPLATPFGTIYAPNLTPDAATGLGSWSADDFWRALHNGKSKDGRFLYPAFPYPNYTKVTRADSDAMYAWFRTLTPVSRPARANALRFPYNQRFLLAYWRTLYFTPGQYVAQSAQNAAWNRGAYLVQGLGHCSACHAPRNALGASVDQDGLGGGLLGGQGWLAPALGGPRDPAQLAELLRSGVSARDAVAGPMAEVVGASLQHVGEGDIGAIAQYLVTLPAGAASLPALPAQDAVLRQGAAIYQRQCASCHGERGEGMARAYPRLADGAAVNAIRMVLDGGYSPSTAGNPRPFGMPPFSATLSDAEVAAVLSYVRASWGNRGAPVLPQDVGRLRATPGA